MKKTHLFKLAPALALGLVLVILVIPKGGLAQPVGGEQGGEQSAAVAMTGAASEASDESPLGNILDISGSSVETDECYQADKTQTLCFTVYNGSTDGEWIKSVRLTFPATIGNWQASCNSAFEDPTDSVGYAVNFSCTEPLVNEVLYQSSDSDGFGEISNGASWGTCVDVYVPPGYTGDRYVAWMLTGDDTPTPDTESGQTKMEKCTPLRLTPSQVTIEGCNGLTQTLEFKLENYEAGNVDLDFTYDAPEADFAGYSPSSIQQGGVITFITQLKPDLFLDPGEQINASLTVEGNGHSDTSVVTQTITENAGWRRRDDSPIPAMDNAVIWANQGDGGLWSIGGYGSKGAAQRYDPASGEWLTHTNPLTPVIEYPVDGCYGLDAAGDEIVVLFPDTLVTDTLQVFNITARQWYTRPIPGFFPSDYIGHWGFDVVSLGNNPAVKPGIVNKNMCYLSGGNHEKPGGGTTRNLWRYDPETNGGEYIDVFTATVYFGFHASWYVPWVGPDGAICVAGGADHNNQINDTTQCYDIGNDSFHAAGVDLGTLPEPWWGMADGWQITDDGYELWIANGVAQDGTLLPASAYIREGMSHFAYGPEIPHGMYRLEGDAWNDQFYTLNGSRGGFWYSEFSLHMGSCPTCHRVYLPLVMRNYQ